MTGDHTFSTWLGNVLGGGAVVTSLAGWLPATITLITASVALVWYLIQIHESETVRRWLANRRARKIVALKAKRLVLEAKLVVLEAKSPPPPAPVA